MPARIDRILAFALVCLAPSAALAQTPQSPMQWPSAQDIDRALKAHPFPGTDRLGSQPVPPPPRVNPRSDAIDIEAIARGESPGDLPMLGTETAAREVAVPKRGRKHPEGKEPKAKDSERKESAKPLAAKKASVKKAAAEPEAPAPKRGNAKPVDDDPDSQQLLF